MACPQCGAARRPLTRQVHKAGTAGGGGGGGGMRAGVAPQITGKNASARR